MTKNFTGAPSSSAGRSYAAPLVTSNMLSTALYTPAFNILRMTSKPVPIELNRYAALAKLSSSDSSADEAEISNAEQGAGLIAPAADPHNDLPEPLVQELPTREPLGGNASIELAKQSVKTQKGKGSKK